MAAPLGKTQDIDALASLEDRVLRAVEAVNRLRQEKEAAEANASRLAEEVESLREERKEVRARIERLLGQIDSLAT